MALNRFRRLSLARQFLFVSMTVTFLIISGISVYMVNASLKARTAQLEVMAEARSSAVIDKIDRNFYERFGDVQAFAFNQLAREVATTGMVSAASQEFINTMVSYYVLYDLMMICDNSGKVVAVNSADKYGKGLQSSFILGKNFGGSTWFKACTSPAGPEGGAWYSDFTINDDVTSLYNRPGYGMAFAAPIRDHDGKVLGVWYNFANWSDVTVAIRKVTEDALKINEPGSFILLTNSRNEVIDSDDTSLLGKTLSLSSLQGGTILNIGNNTINSKDYVVGAAVGNGAYTFKGKKWNAITFVPRTTLSLTYLYQNLGGFIVAMLLVLILTGVLFYRLASAVSLDLKKLQSNIEELATGALPEIERSKRENEIGEITNALIALSQRTRASASFARAIGNGNFSEAYSSLGHQDVLGESLVSMKNNLAKLQEEEGKRNWITAGLAQFGEILRNNSDWKKMNDDIISGLVKYLDANQGGLFIINDENPADTYLELTACWAWDRKRFVEKRIDIGQGLIGQCWAEKDIIYLKDVPQDYVSITSGLGHAAPRNVILIPLSYNDTVYGVIELASFRYLKDHERSFCEEIARAIAAAIANTRTNFRTHLLLQQQQLQSEQLRAQEEEMRQNMEELSATQEEMIRKEQEYIRRIKDLEGTIRKRTAVEI